MRGKIVAFLGFLILTSVLLGLLGGSPAVADLSNVEKVEQQGGEAKVLTLQEAIDYAFENNYNLKLADLARKKAYIEADQASSLTNVLEKAPITSTGTLLAKHVNEKIKENLRVIADKTYEVAKEQVKLQVESKYFAVLQAKDLVKVSEASLKRANRQLENAKAAFDVGTVAKTDVLAAEVGVAQAQASLVAAKNDLEIAVIEFNRVIGADSGAKFELVSSISYEPPPQVDLEEEIAAAMKTRLDMASAETAVTNAELTWKAIGDYIPGTYEARLYGVQVDQARLAKEETVKQVVSDLTQAYLNIRAADETVNYLKAGLEQARENMRLTNLRYEVGMVTSYEVLDASVKLADIEAKYVKALYSYNIAKLAYETAKVAPLSGSASSAVSSSSSSSSR